MRAHQPGEENARLFVAAYLSNGRNASAAYRSIHPGVTAKSAAQLGSDMLRRERVLDIMREEMGEAMKKFDVTPERIIQELACMAFADVGELYDDAGELLPLTEMAEEVRRAIVGLEVKHNQFGSTVNAKLESKRAALELLGKHLAMWTDVHRSEGNDDLVAAILGARKRVRTTTVEEDVFS